MRSKAGEEPRNEASVSKNVPKQQKIADGQLDHNRERWGGRRRGKRMRGEGRVERGERERRRGKREEGRERGGEWRG